MLDDVHLLAASEDRCWSVWDIAAERLTSVTACPLGAVRGVAMAPDQVGRARARAQLFDAVTVEPRARPPPLRPADAPNGRTRGARPRQVSVATVGLDRAINIWDLRQRNAGAPAARIADAHASEATAVAWHPGGAALASGGADAAVRLFDARRAGGGGGGGAGGALIGSYAGHTGAVARLGFSPDGNQLASAGADGCCALWRFGA